MNAYVKNVRISPKKLRVIAEAVKGMSAQEALDILKFMPKKGADILYKAVHSAVSNAKHNDDVQVENLNIYTICVDKGVVYKRGNPVGRGRYHRILKRTSNVSVSLETL